LTSISIPKTTGGREMFITIAQWIVINRMTTILSELLLGTTRRKLNLAFGHQGLGKNFKAEAGFVPSLEVYPGAYM
jgi:hypothetical protein